MKTIYAIAGRIYQHVRPVRDPHYLQFIRSFPCVGCKTVRKQRDAMHVGPRGMGQKASDLDTLPGCRSCHGELHEIGPMKFQSRHEIDFAELNIMFRGFYCLTFPTRKGSIIGTSEECSTGNGIVVEEGVTLPSGLEE